MEIGHARRKPDLLDLERRVLGPDRPETAQTTYSLASVKAKQAKRKNHFRFCVRPSIMPCCLAKV